MEEKLSTVQILDLIDSKVEKAVTIFKLELQRDLTPFVDNSELIKVHLTRD